MLINAKKQGYPIKKAISINEDRKQLKKGFNLSNKGV